jgi:hypothetical protein
MTTGTAGEDHVILEPASGFGPPLMNVPLPADKAFVRLVEHELDVAYRGSLELLESGLLSREGTGDP